ncbi:hypothetical protein PF008_g33277, partial [Phytophthora fragariae]
RVEPIDAGPSDAGDASNDSCSDDRGRSSSGYCDSGGRHCTIVSSRLTPGQVTPETPAATPAPTIEVEAAAAIATPAGATARSCRDVGPIDAGDVGCGSCSDDRGRNSNADCDISGRL